MAIDQIVAEELTRLITAKADLKTSIEAKGVTVPSSAKLDDYPDYVDAISTGVTPTGNIDITQAGVTDVTNYATATVPSGSLVPDYGEWFATENGVRKYKIQPKYSVSVAGWVANNAVGSTETYDAIASNTTITPTESAQTIGGNLYMMEGAVTVNAIPSNYVGSGITQRTSSDLTASGATVTAPAGYYSSDATKSVSTMTLPTTLSNSASGTQKAEFNLPDGINKNLVIPAGYNTTQSYYTFNVPNAVYDTPTWTISKNSANFSMSCSIPISSAGYSANGFLATKGILLENKTATPSETQQTITPTDNNHYLDSVIVSAIPSNYVGSGITSRDSTDLTASGATVTAPAGYYSSAATKTITSGSATPAASISGSSATVTAGTNTLTFTKTISNTPQVSAGYISSGTAGNTNVSLTASINTRSSSDLTASNLTVTAPSGYYASNATKTLTDANLLATNIKKDVSIFGVTGTYEGSGGGSSSDGVYVDDSYNDEMNTASSSIEFNGLLGAPTSFIIRSITPNMATPSGTPYKVVAVVYDGTSYHGQTLTNTNNAQVSYDGSSFSHTYSNGILTVTSTGPYFQPNDYMLEYSYGGTAANVHTANVQVGSGATSITFTGLEDEPLYWSCIFKSNFSTSNGYQRVIWVENTSNTIVGMAMDSSGHYSGSLWTASYNNGSLTISSQGTNSGGYFHQPGYYQLTYVTASSGGGEGGGETINNQDKTVTPSETQQTITADSGYTGLGTVTVGAIDSNYVGSNVTRKAAATITPGTTNQTIATGTYLTGTQTISGDSDLIASNIKSGVSIFNVTGTYTGDVVTGTLNVASNVNSSTSTQITTTTAIGYTPTKFLFYKTERTATSNHVHQATFTTIGSYYIRTMTRYSSNALSTSGNTNNWTTQTAGYLYFNNNTIYFRSSSSYILSAGTWNWVAIR